MKTPLLTFFDPLRHSYIAKLYAMFMLPLCLMLGVFSGIFLVHLEIDQLALYESASMLLGIGLLLSMVAANSLLKVTDILCDKTQIIAGHFFATDLIQHYLKEDIDLSGLVSPGPDLAKEENIEKKWSKKLGKEPITEVSIQDHSFQK